MSLTIKNHEANKHDRKICREFESYHEYIKFGESGPSEANRQAGRGSSRSDRPDHDWDMRLGYEGSVKLGRSGWSDVRADVETLASTVKDKLGHVMTDTFTPIFDRRGSTVHVGRMLSGHQKCMIRQQVTQQPRNTNVVTLVVEAGVSGSFTSETLLKRGAAILALVDVLRSMNVTCEVWLTFDGGQRSGICHLVPLVRSGQRVDLDELMFALVHPASLRRIGFAAMEAEKIEIPSGYGSPQEKPNSWVVERVAPTIAVNGTRSRDGVPGEIVNDPAGWIMRQLDGAGLVGENGWDQASQ